jgi:hypothetical protein
MIGHVEAYTMSSAVAAAAAFLWLGMVLAISFIEAPLKFRAPGITLQLGLGIGRLVFRVINRIEVGLLLVLAAAVAVGPRPAALITTAAALVALLAVQLLVVRPALNRRSDRVLAGADVPRSRQHLFYVALEFLKVAVLASVGIAAMAA